MATYMIGYDLNKPLQNYTKLIQTIKEYSTWWHHLDSTWIVVTTESAIQVRDKLVQCIDSNDELLVATITAPAAWTGFSERGSSWLKDKL